MHSVLLLAKRSRSNLRSLSDKLACRLVSLGYPKSQDGRSNLTQFLTFFRDSALDVTTFAAFGFVGFFEREKAENPCYVWVFSLFYVPLKSVNFF